MTATEIREMLFGIQYEEIRCLKAEIYTTLILCKEAEKAGEVGHLEGLRSLVETIRLDNVVKGGVRCFCKAGRIQN